MADFAPGIPSKDVFSDLPKIEDRTKWEFALQEHKAERRGPHFDLRLGDPQSGQAHSWALQQPLPKPGESSFAIQQPTHTVSYMGWEGTIPKGTYGAGEVRVADKAPTEVVNARPGHISFNIYKGSGPEEFTLHKINDGVWKLYNRTLNRTQHPELPVSKPKYRQIAPEDLNIDDKDVVVSAKLDDAHNLFYFPPDGSRVRVLSYRKGKTRDVIEHTHKIPTLMEDVKIPKELRGTILRGGLYAKSTEGQVLPVRELAGMLNSDVWKSRETQQKKGPLIPVLYDVVKFHGKDMEDRSYAEKLEALGEVVSKMPNTFELPDMAFTADQKKKLIESIAKGKHPDTEEGVVLWNLKKPGAAPIKAKFRQEHDVYIRDFVPGSGKYKDKGVGAFTFSHTPRGEIVGRVGTGISDAQRLDMFENPEKYKGAVVRVKAHDKYPSGALRVPAMMDFHPDKNPQDVLDILKLASMDFNVWSSILYEPVMDFIWGDI